MSANLFSASRMKIARASQFVGELNSVVYSYKLSRPVNGFFDPLDNGTIHIRFAPFGLLPGAIIGDILHNLRASLDLMASEMARLNGKSDKNVYFPFSDGEASIEEQIAKKNFSKAGDDAVQLLLATIKPYRGGNDQLRAIHELDISDKHTVSSP